LFCGDWRFARRMIVSLPATNLLLLSLGTHHARSADVGEQDVVQHAAHRQHHGEGAALSPSAMRSRISVKRKRATRSRTRSAGRQRVPWKGRIMPSPVAAAGQTCLLQGGSRRIKRHDNCKTTQTRSGLRSD
jgi:hypothetical protein